jgi:hypothetical protein
VRVVHLVGGERELGGQLQREVGCAERPVVLQRHFRELLIDRPPRIAAGRPRQHDVDLFRRQGVRALQIAEALVGVPRRHVPGDELGANRFGPRKRVVVGHQRHRRHAAGHVAAGAAVAQDREDVVVVGVLRRDRLVRLARDGCQQRGPCGEAGGNRDADAEGRAPHGCAGKDD